MQDKLKIPVEVWTRVVGYFRPVSQFNKAKEQEYNDRKNYKVSKDFNEVFK